MNTKPSENMNAAALDAYVAAQVQHAKMCARVLAAAVAHQDRQAPEAVEWRHVADLDQARKMLAEVERFLNQAHPVV